MRLEELFAYIILMGIIATCLQETWRTGTEVLENSGSVLLLAGQDAALQTVKRGSQGVVIALNTAGVVAWRAGGCVLHNDFGGRLIAIRLLVRDLFNNDVGVFLVSAYAPVSSESDQVWELYYDQMDACIARKQPDDILIIGTDSNSSIGTKAEQSEVEDANSVYRGPVGSFGLPPVHSAGRHWNN